MRAGGNSRVRPSRARKTYFELPPLELECMKVLWRLGEASVREIRAGLPRALAYTTVETIMDRLTRKAIVARQRVGKAHRYTARYEKAEARVQAVAALVEHFFGGSRAALRAHLEGLPVVEPEPPRSAPLPRPERTARPAAARPIRARRTTAPRRESAPPPPPASLDITLL
jgi:predicted transcriptional regulator